VNALLSIYPDFDWTFGNSIVFHKDSGKIKQIAESSLMAWKTTWI